MTGSRNIFEENIQRECEHIGQERICRICSKVGIVGTNVVAATTVTTTSNEPLRWWVHLECVNNETVEKNTES